MAGPVASVLLREPLAKAQLKEIDQWLRSVATRVDGARPPWRMGIVDGRGAGWVPER